MCFDLSRLTFDGKHSLPLQDGGEGEDVVVVSSKIKSRETFDKLLSKKSCWLPRYVSCKLYSEIKFMLFLLKKLWLKI